MSGLFRPPKGGEARGHGAPGRSRYMRQMRRLRSTSWRSRHNKLDTHEPGASTQAGQTDGQYHV
jgi:hypothetical protein